MSDESDTENLIELQQLKQQTKEVRAEVVGFLLYVSEEIDDALDLRGEIKLKRRFQRKEKDDQAKRIRQEKIVSLVKQFEEIMDKLQYLVLPLREMFDGIQIDDYIDLDDRYKSMGFSTDANSQCIYALDALRQVEKLADEASSVYGKLFENFKVKQRDAVLYSKQIVKRTIWIIEGMAAASGRKKRSR